MLSNHSLLREGDTYGILVMAIVGRFIFDGRCRWSRVAWTQGSRHQESAFLLTTNWSSWRRSGPGWWGWVPELARTRPLWLAALGMFALHDMRATISTLRYTSVVDPPAGHRHATVAHRVRALGNCPISISCSLPFCALLEIRRGVRLCVRTVCDRYDSSGCYGISGGFMSRLMWVSDP